MYKKHFFGTLQTSILAYLEGKVYGYIIIPKLIPFESTLTTMASATLPVSLAAAVLVLVTFFLWHRRCTSLPLGPKGSWIIGNSVDLLTESLWEKFSAWTKDFGAWLRDLALIVPI